MKGKKPNRLASETSPYLLQHAHNPVRWHAWREEALEQARRENKLLLISIGYAACHWCHVMEKETFEDEAAATVMNEHFINIKVDREERPDIDHIYMEALQLMTGSGGWPLNIVALPDGKPIWGGTYLTKESWMETLLQLAQLYQTQTQKVTDYAHRLQEGMIQNNLISPAENTHPISTAAIKEAVKRWSAHFDYEYGGTRHAPKFMMPVNLRCLLQYAVQFQDQAVFAYLQTSLTRMAQGGIYDAIGGGFSRYSVDEKWHIPHFEKMLYDNAQLVSLYSEAYKITRKAGYGELVRQTLAFVEEAWMTPEGGFYTSLDADSPNEKGTWEEGAFYIWKKPELESLLQADFPLFADYYNVNDLGYWENGNYVLLQTAPDEEVAQKHAISMEKMNITLFSCKAILQEARNRRAKPRLDTKILTSWNALMLKGYVDAYKALGEERYLATALKTASFLLSHACKEDGGLYRQCRNGQSPINGFLEDYAHLCDAFIALYEACGDEKWLTHSKQWVNYCYDYFYDDSTHFFNFTSRTDPTPIMQPVEITDQVIPSSNSVMAKVLWKLARYFENPRYADTATAMLRRIAGDVLHHPYNHANWLTLALWRTYGFYEIALVGADSKKLLKPLHQHYLPNALVAVTETGSPLPLLKNKTVSGKTLIYVCKNNHCELPVHTVKEALEQLR